MKYYTLNERSDGFGAQFQTIIFGITYCEKNNYKFLYNQIKKIEHNYDNDLDFIYKIDKLINLKNNYDTYQSFDNKSDVYFLNDIISIFLNKINLERCAF